MRRALTQAEIDAAIQEWNGNIESKHAVVRYMKDHAREKDTAAWLRQEYGDDLPALPVTVDGAAGDVPGPRCSAGSSSSSRKIGSTPRRSRTDLTTSTPSPSGRPWPSAAS